MATPNSVLGGYARCAAAAVTPRAGSRFYPVLPRGGRGERVDPAVGGPGNGGRERLQVTHF